MAAITAAPAGGNCEDSSTWEAGVVPTTDDDVIVPAVAVVSVSNRAVISGRSIALRGRIVGE